MSTVALFGRVSPPVTPDAADFVGYLRQQAVCGHYQSPVAGAGLCSPQRRSCHPLSVYQIPYSYVFAEASKDVSVSPVAAAPSETPLPSTQGQCHAAALHSAVCCRGGGGGNRRRRHLAFILRPERRGWRSALTLMASRSDDVAACSLEHWQLTLYYRVVWWQSTLRTAQCPWLVTFELSSFYF